VPFFEPQFPSIDILSWIFYRDFPVMSWNVSPSFRELAYSKKSFPWRVTRIV